MTCLEDCRRQLLKQSANMIITSQFSKLSILSRFGSETSPKKQQKRKRAFFLNQKLSVNSLLVIQYFTQIVLFNAVFIFCFAAVVK